LEPAFGFSFGVDAPDGDGLDALLLFSDITAARRAERSLPGRDETWLFVAIVFASSFGEAVDSVCLFDAGAPGAFARFR
jgi:hypothetical protein